MSVIFPPKSSCMARIRNPEGEVFYHFDFYRIEDPEEVLEIGLDEYLDSGRHCWIEWAEKIAGYLPSDFIHIQIEVDEKEGRNITLKRVINGQTDG